MSMFDLIKQHKFIVGAGILAVAIGAWFALSDGSAPASDGLLTATPVADETGHDVIEVLLKLRSIKLDATIFSDPAFLALQDFSTQIIPEPVGRPNPFAPLNPAARPTAASTKGASIFSKDYTSKAAR